MLVIENVLVSDQVISEQFVCDLSKCKGACCVDGDAGAPLTAQEMEKINEIFPEVKPYLTKEGLEEIKNSGKYIFEEEFGWVTPTIKGKMCAYGIIDEKGIVKCGIEQAFIDKKINFRKPVSCHLFPILVDKSKTESTFYVNYSPRPDICKPGCALGKKLKVPVYKFLKEPLIRKFGEEFYEALEATANHLKQNK